MTSLNDPRVLLAAERSLLAWTRTIISLIGFGFLIERFGLLLHTSSPAQQHSLGQMMSLLIGESFILVGALLAFYSTAEHWRTLKNLGPTEIPPGHRVWVAPTMNLFLAVMAVVLAAYVAARLWH